MFLPQYTQLNPIKDFFGNLKSKISETNRGDANRNDLKINIDSLLEHEDISFLGCYNNVRMCVEKANARQVLL